MLFGDYDVDFWLQTNSAEVNLVYFSVFSIFRIFSAFKNFYLIFKNSLIIHKQNTQEMYL